MRIVLCFGFAIFIFLVGAIGWTYIEGTKLVSPCVFSLDVRTTEECKHDPLNCALAVRVIDGDTIECHGHILRLDGYNAPELSRSVCVNPANQQMEYEQGRKAKEVLAMLIAGETWPQRPAVGGQNCGFGRWCFNLQLRKGVSAASQSIGKVMEMCGQASSGTGHTGWCRPKKAFDREGCEAYMRDRFPKQEEVWLSIVSPGQSSRIED